MRSVIYEIVFPDGTSYIGSTAHFSQRRRQHLRASRKDKYKTSQALQDKLREFPVCSIYQVASVIREDDRHLAEADVIASRAPTLNCTHTPTRIHRHKPGESANSRAFGPYPSISAAAKALGTNRTRLREFGSYDAFVAHKEAVRNRETKASALQGPPDPRNNCSLAYVNGGWHSRDALQEQYGLSRKELNRRLLKNRRLDAPVSLKLPITRVCERYGVNRYRYNAARAAGATVRQALGLDPFQPNRKAVKVKKRVITVNGQSATVNVWAKRAGVTPNVVHSRLHLGWTEAQAVGAEPSPKQAKMAEAAAREGSKVRRKPTFTVRGVTGTLEELARAFDVPTSTVFSRRRNGWKLEECLVIRELPPGWSIKYARTTPHYQRLMGPAPPSCPANVLDT